MELELKLEPRKFIFKTKKNGFFKSKKPHNTCFGSIYWFGYWVLGLSIQNFEKRNQNWNQNYELNNK